MIFLSLVQNIALLMALAVVHQVSANSRTARWFRNYPLLLLMLSGLAFGGFGIAGMMTPVRFAPGVIFDGRSIILAVAGLFGGPVVAAIAAVTCGAYRIWLGGGGALMGICVIGESAALGVVFHYLRKRNPHLMDYLPLWGFGLLVHAVMLGCMLLLPDETRWEVMRRIGPPVLLLYPVATMIICRLFADQENRAKAEASLLASEVQYRELVEHANSIILRWDRSGKITFFSEYGSRFFGFSREEIVGRNLMGTIVPATDTSGRDLENMVHDIVAHPEKYATNQNENMRRDGTRVWVAWTNRPILDDRGKCVEILAVGNDITDRRRAEEALRENQRRLQAVLDYSPALISMKDLQGNVILANRNFSLLDAPPLQEFIGQNVFDIFPKEVAQALWENDQAAVRAGTAVQAEESVPHKDGTLHTYLTVKFPVGDANGMVFGTCAISTDITDRRKAEEALRESEKKYRLLTESIKDVVWVLDAETMYFRYVSPSVERLRGYTPETILAEPVTQALTEEYAARLVGLVRSRTQDLLSGRATTDTFYADEFEQPCRDGSTVWTEVVTSYYINQENGRVEVRGVTRDISERKRAEEDFREGEERHRTILQTAMDGFWVVDMQGCLREVNETYCRMSGYCEQELLAMRIADLDAFETVDATATHMQKVMALGEDRFESRHRRKDGTVFDVEIGVQYRPAQGGLLVAFLHDITNRKQAEMEKDRLEDELRQIQRMESVGRLAGGVAHDFNNMLAVILGYTEVAMGQVGPDQPLYADLREVYTAATRSADLTRQLLAFARRQTIAPKVLDLNDTVSGMLKLLRRLIGENIQLDWHPGTNLWPVRVDPSQIDQLLANLSVNARDAIADVGIMLIGTENCVVDECYCAGHPGFVPGKYVLLTVSDNGCGMDPELAAHIFEPFFTTKEMGKGTGLGLATVYGIVKQNRGFIDVQSEPGQGTIFRIYLPRHAGDTGQAQQEGDAGPLLSGHETILLVEDERAFLKLAATMLERHGYTVLTAGTPGEAIRLAKNHPGAIALLMTDVVMPEMNGRDLSIILLRLYPQLRCLYMSGYTADAIASHGVLDEGTHFIQKPFSSIDLAAKVRELLDNK